MRRRGAERGRPSAAHPGTGCRVQPLSPTSRRGPSVDDHDPLLGAGFAIYYPQAQATSGAGLGIHISPAVTIGTRQWAHLEPQVPSLGFPIQCRLLLASSGGATTDGSVRQFNFTVARSLEGSVSFSCQRITARELPLENNRQRVTNRLWNTLALWALPSPPRRALAGMPEVAWGTFNTEDRDHLRPWCWERSIGTGDDPLACRAHAVRRPYIDRAPFLERPEAAWEHARVGKGAWPAGSPGPPSSRPGRSSGTRASPGQRRGPRPGQRGPRPAAKEKGRRSGIVAG